MGREWIKKKGFEFRELDVDLTLDIINASHRISILSAIDRSRSIMKIDRT